MNLFVSPTYISASAASEFEAYSAIFDAIVAAGGDWAIEGPFSTGILNGALVTGRGYIARMTAGAALDAAHAEAAAMLAAHEAYLARKAA